MSCEKLIEIAKRLLNENPDSILTGSLMLHLRGIDIGREPQDIDIIFEDYATFFKVPEYLEFEEIGTASDGCSLRIGNDSIKVDVISGGEEFDVINDIPLAKVEGLISVKENYADQENPAAEKHKADLEVLKNYLKESDS